MPGPFPYQAGFGSTLAPTCKLELSWQGRIANSIEAVLDSGASRTVIPKSLVVPLGLRRVGQGGAGGAFSASSQQPKYVVDIKLLIPNFNKVFQAHTVFAGNFEFVLLGRDILNLYRLLLDGQPSEYTII